MEGEGGTREVRADIITEGWTREVRTDVRRKDEEGGQEKLF